MIKNWTHRQRLEQVIAGNTPDRVPVALWKHFPVDDQTPEGLASATLAFQSRYDFDLVKVTPASSFCLKDWGAADEWRGAAEGTRDYTHRVVEQPADWEKLKLLEPEQGHLGAQLRALNLIMSQMESGTPVLQTIFSPMAQAKNLVGKQALQVHLRRFPDALHLGLRTITESTIRFVEKAAASGISGIFYAVQHAQYGLLSEDEFSEFGRPYDFQVLEVVQNLWLNMVHLHGSQVMFDQVIDYPAAVINWHDRETPPSLAEGLAKFPGVVCGGLRRQETMVLATPDQVKAEALDAIQATKGRRFILGTGCVVPQLAPRGNWLAARQSVQESVQT